MIAVYVCRYEVIGHALSPGSPVVWGVNRWMEKQEDNIARCWTQCLNETQKSTVLYASVFNWFVLNTGHKSTNIHDYYELLYWSMAIEGSLYKTLDDVTDCCKDFSGLNAIFNMNYPEKSPVYHFFFE